MVYDLFAKPLQMMSSMYHTEGLSALWKGLGPNLVGIIPSRAIYFGTYSQGKYFLMEMNDGKENSLIHLGAAAAAGVTVATVTCPLWVVKTRMQLQSTTAKLGGVKVTDASIPYKNSFDCVKRIVLEEGAKGLYKGLTASYLGVIESTLQFVMYEKLKGVMKQHRAENPPTFLPPHLQGLDSLFPFFFCLVFCLTSFFSFFSSFFFLHLLSPRMDRLLFHCCWIKTQCRLDHLPPRSCANEDA